MEKRVFIQTFSGFVRTIRRASCLHGGASPRGTRGGRLIAIRHLSAGGLETETWKAFDRPIVALRDLRRCFRRSPAGRARTQKIVKF